MQRRKKDADVYEQRALKYRGECLRHASETMPRDGQPVTDYAIGMSGHLSFTEVGVANIMSSKKNTHFCKDVLLISSLSVYDGRL